MLDYYSGMDISSLPESLEKGMQLYDGRGDRIDAFDLMEAAGVNLIRLRIWNEPDKVKESGGYCDLSRTVQMAKRAKEKGMQVLLNFHYSDWWADPGKQNKPEAWRDLHGGQLVEAVYRFTVDTIRELENNGALPEIVQIGNEVRSGLLFPDGELPNIQGMVDLLNAGLKAVKDHWPEIQTMIHLDQGGRYSYIKSWFDDALSHGLLDYDIMGLSYYPFWHGTFSDLKSTMTKVLDDYGKPIMLVEVAHAWRLTEKSFIDEDQVRIAGFAASPEGQRQVLDLINQIVASLPDNKGLGTVYWEPINVPEESTVGWGENMGIIGPDGRPMPALESFSFKREDLNATQVAKIYYPSVLGIADSSDPQLPGSFTVLYMDGTTTREPVEWDIPDLGQLGEGSDGAVSIKAYMPTINEHVMIDLVKQSPPAHRENLLNDPNWDEGLVHWQISEDAAGDPDISIVPEFRDPFPAPPVNQVTVGGARNFHWGMEQTYTLSAAGTYTLEIAYQGADTTGVDIKLFIEADDREAVVLHPLENDWQVASVQASLQSGDRVTVGLSIDSPPNVLRFREMKLVLEAKS